MNSKLWKGQVISWTSTASKGILDIRTHGKLPTGMFPCHLNGFRTVLGTGQQQIKYKCSELMCKAHSFFMAFTLLFTLSIPGRVLRHPLCVHHNLEQKVLFLSVFCSSYLSIISDTAGSKLPRGYHVLSRSPCWWASCKHPVSFRAITTSDLFSMWL